MAWYEEDDESQNPGFEDTQSRRRGGRDDSWDREDSMQGELVPDEMGTVRCGHCKKLIFEDSVRCPYCKQLQLDEESSGKPRWLVITAIIVLIGFAGYFVTTFLDMLHWLHR